MLSRQEINLHTTPVNPLAVTRFCLAVTRAAAAQKRVACLSGAELRRAAKEHAVRLSRQATNISDTTSLAWMVLAPFMRPRDFYCGDKDAPQQLEAHSLASLMSVANDDQDDVNDPFLRDDSYTHTLRLLQRSALDVGDPYEILPPRSGDASAAVADIASVSGLILKTYVARVATIATKLAQEMQQPAVTPELLRAAMYVVEKKLV